MGDERTEPVRFPEPVVQYGKEAPLPVRHELRAGPLTAVLEGGDLRYVRLGDDEVVLRLYAAIRDQNWNTIEPAYVDYALEREDGGFVLRFAAENVSGDVDFAWNGELRGTPDGVITATMDGVARKAFLKNRIGWCVLHPMSLAGSAATTETPDGPVEGQFPERISPHQPFIDMEAIAHETSGGGRVVIRFEGDLFEMEDQRNWTDASYKTYSTPLRLPYPAPIAEGEQVWQRVTIEATGAPSAARAGEAVQVALDLASGRPMLPLGVGVPGHGAPLEPGDAALLRAIRPAHFHTVLDLGSEQWRDRLAYATDLAGQLDAALEIEAIAAEGDAGFDQLAAALETLPVPIARMLVFPHEGMVTTAGVLAAARSALRETGIVAPIGGGTRAYFTELNRATLPLAEMDVVGYTINPQVHAFDNASLTETLAAQAETVRSARAIAGERPLAVGPITLSPRFNPNATGPEPPTPPGELPPSVDARQPSLFAAGWLAGSINALGNAGADALTYFETTGWKGLIERRDHPLRIPAFHSWPGMVFPVYHVLADAGDFRDGEIVPVKVSDPLQVQALALRDGRRLRVILANMRNAPARVLLDLPDLSGATMRRLDAATAFEAASEPAAFRESREPLTVSDGAVTIALPPFGLATIDAEKDLA
jgi:hypothetical protein